jgi:hypothetical protein
VYRPTRADGTEYRNSDIVVAQYAGGELKFFERVGGVWSESTAFFVVVMPKDLPQGGALPSFWVDRAQPVPGLVPTSITDPAFASGGAAPVRLVSLVDVTPSGLNAFTEASQLASYDPAGQGRNPFVPLVYGPFGGNLPSPTDGTLVLGQAFGTTGQVEIPGTRVVPKVLITNDPGLSDAGVQFSPGTVTSNGTVTTDIGRIVVSGKVYETNALGTRIVHGIDGTGFDSAGDLRSLALKIVSFDTRSVYQDSPIAPQVLGSPNLGECSVANPNCLDDPNYVLPTSGNGSNFGTHAFNDYPRIVYPDSSTDSRCPSGSCASQTNPVSPGFQAKGYLSQVCTSALACDRPGPAANQSLADYYLAGEPANTTNANPNRSSASLAWADAQPGTNSVGRFEFFQGRQPGSGATTFAKPALNNPDTGDSVLGVGEGLYKINSVVFQVAPLATGSQTTPTRSILAINRGLIAGQGLILQSDGTSAYKTSLPDGPAIASADIAAVPVFQTILPTTDHLPTANSSLAVANALPGAQASVAAQPPIDAPEPYSDSRSSTPSTSPTSSDPAFLILGGRGLAQSVDLGRSGGLGVARSVSTKVVYEVACTVDAPGPLEAQAKDADKRTTGRRITQLPPCR